MAKVFAKLVSQLRWLRKCVKRSKIFSEILINICHKDISLKLGKENHHHHNVTETLANSFFLQLVHSGCHPVQVRKLLRAPASSQKGHSVLAVSPKPHASLAGISAFLHVLLLLISFTKSAAQWQTWWVPVMTAQKVALQQSGCARIRVQLNWIWDGLRECIFFINNFWPVGTNKRLKCSFQALTVWTFSHVNNYNYRQGVAVIWHKNINFIH